MALSTKPYDPERAAYVPARQLMTARTSVPLDRAMESRLLRYSEADNSIVITFLIRPRGAAYN